MQQTEIQEITPVILAGGTGTRLWPLSKASFPKQFSYFSSELTLFQETVLRLSGAKNLKLGRPLIITSEEFRFHVLEQLDAIKIEPENILLEPMQRNTGPAILAATLYKINQNENSILLFAPSDHVMENKQLFHKCISAGAKHAKNGKIVTFGIKPDRLNETGYGYLELNEAPKHDGVELISFLEKPSLPKANEMVTAGNFLWNSGIFLSRGDRLVEQFTEKANEMYEYVTQSLKKSELDLGFLRLEKSSWKRCDNISFDYAILEKCNNLITIPYEGRWSDLGTWTSVSRELELENKDEKSKTNILKLDCNNTLLRSENPEQVMVGLGLEDVIAVATDDAILIMNKNRSEEVKGIVEKLNKRNISQAKNSSLNYRPWGWYKSLIMSNNFQVKRIYVKSMASLSLQSHKHRSEHWIVVKGVATITSKGEKKQLYEGQSTFIPKGDKHRLENQEIEPLEIIEVQYGDYLGEDDIVRYTDIYGRVK